MFVHRKSGSLIDEFLHCALKFDIIVMNMLTSTNISPTFLKKLINVTIVCSRTKHINREFSISNILQMNFAVN